MCSRFRINFCLPIAILIFYSASADSLQKKFRICAEPANLPMSDKASNSGYEIEVAKLLASSMKESLQVIWVPQRDHSYYRQTLGRGNCDALMSVPSHLAQLTATRPWYKAGFEFVAKANQNLPNSFDDPKLRKLSVGVPAIGLGETPPALALTRRSLASQLRPYSVYEPAKLMSAVEEGAVDLAIVWGPFASWYAREKPQLKLRPTPDNDGDLALAFDISVGVKKGNLQLKEKIESALEEQKVAIQEVLKKWRVPSRGN
jgi:mxaJ protein